MKRNSLTLVGAVTVLGLVLVLPALAEDKQMSITGEAKCAKCALHEGDKCQSVVQVKKDGKTTTYYLAENDVSKTFHKNVCQDTKKATATGTDKVVDGKHQFTATKIELEK